MGNKGTLDLQMLPQFGDEPGLPEGEATGRRLPSDPCQRRQLRDSPSVGGLPPVTPRGTLNSGRESQRGLGGLPSSSLSVRTFPLLQPVPDWDGDPGAQLCEGGPCLWLFSPYLVRELHATFLAPPGASEWQPGVEGGLRLAPVPTPGWDQPLLLVPAARRRLPADRRRSPGQRDRDRLPNGGFPRTASLSATATLSEGGCPFSGSFVSVWGTHMGWGVPDRVG